MKRSVRLGERNVRSIQSDQEGKGLRDACRGRSYPWQPTNEVLPLHTVYSIISTLWTCDAHCFLVWLLAKRSWQGALRIPTGRSVQGFEYYAEAEA